MIIHLSRSGDVLTLRARAEGPDALGDLAIELHPGEAALGRTHAEWAAMPDGPHEVG